MEDKEKTYGRVSLSLKQSESDLSFIEADLRQIGKDWEQAGKSVQRMQGSTLDRATVEETLGRIWNLIQRQVEIAEECDTLRVELAGIK